MRLFLLVLIFVLGITFGCSKKDSSIIMEELPSDNNMTDNSKYFDSLASLGTEYGFLTVVPRRDFDIVLSKPNNTNITATILCYQDCVGYLSYNSTSTPEISFRAGVAQRVILQDLLPNSKYTYQFNYKKRGSSLFISSKQYGFNTPKNSSESFSFAIIADSHLDENSDTTVYQHSLNNILNENNDFLVDLGDTFMVDKYGQQDYKKSHGQFLAQRYFLGGICNSIPLYFIQGNHDGEAGAKREEITAWSKSIRENYFPNPTSENYFAWEWGNALMISLDPYTFTSAQGAKDPWQRTLGLIQYQWLENTLKNSNKEYKFVFIHNLIGGVDADGQARGGSEAAPYWEWGGRNMDMIDEFSTKRFNWKEPIHNLLKRYGVQVVFHGHDHLYAKQEYDGIIYQCVQQPALKRYNKLTYGDDYGYKNGIIKYDPGHLRVTICPNTAKIDYISHINETLDSYTL